MRKKSKFIDKLPIYFLAFIVCSALLLIVTGQFKVEIINAFGSQPTDKYRTITNEDYNSLNQFIVENENTVIFVTSQWCSLCNPIRDEIKKNINNYRDVSFVELDLDIYRKMLDRFNINQAPALVFLSSNSARNENFITIENVDEVIKTNLNI